MQHAPISRARYALKERGRGMRGRGVPDLLAAVAAQARQGAHTGQRFSDRKYHFGNRLIKDNRQCGQQDG